MLNCIAFMDLLIVEYCRPKGKLDAVPKALSQILCDAADCFLFYHINN